MSELIRKIRELQKLSAEQVVIEGLKKKGLVAEDKPCGKEMSTWIYCSERQPDIGDEYNVLWDIKDGSDPVVTTMEYDAIRKKWIDVIGDGSYETENVIAWQPLPDPPENK